jgi:hypothetical protein
MKYPMDYAALYLEMQAWFVARKGKRFAVGAARNMNLFMTVVGWRHAYLAGIGETTVMGSVDDMYAFAEKFGLLVMRGPYFDDVLEIHVPYLYVVHPKSMKERLPWFAELAESAVSKKVFEKNFSRRQFLIGKILGYPDVAVQGVLTPDIFRLKRTSLTVDMQISQKTPGLSKYLYTYSCDSAKMDQLFPAIKRDILSARPILRSLSGSNAMSAVIRHWTERTPKSSFSKTFQNVMNVAGKHKKSDLYNLYLTVVGFQPSFQCTTLSPSIVEEFGLVLVTAPSMDKERASYAVHPTRLHPKWFDALRAATNQKQREEWIKRILGYPDQAMLVSGKVRLCIVSTDNDVHTPLHEFYCDDFPKIFPRVFQNIIDSSHYIEGLGIEITIH